MVNTVQRPNSSVPSPIPTLFSTMLDLTERSLVSPVENGIARLPHYPRRIHVMGEAQEWLFEPTFDRSIKVRQKDQRLTLDVGVAVIARGGSAQWVIRLSAQAFGEGACGNLVAAVTRASVIVWYAFRTIARRKPQPERVP